jgi:hypothetical protein
MITEVILDQSAFDPTDPDERDLAHVDAVTWRGWVYVIEADLSEPPWEWYIAYVHFPRTLDPYGIISDRNEEIDMGVSLKDLPGRYRKMFIEDLLNAPVTRWYS